MSKNHHWYGGKEIRDEIKMCLDYSPEEKLYGCSFTAIHQIDPLFSMSHECNHYRVKDHGDCQRGFTCRIYGEFWWRKEGLESHEGKSLSCFEGCEVRTLQLREYMDHLIIIDLKLTLWDKKGEVSVLSNIIVLPHVTFGFDLEDIRLETRMY